MTYEQGFAAGEKDAFNDREDGLSHNATLPRRSEYERGYADGYTPRNPAWWRRGPRAVAAQNVAERVAA